jgi:hypothetical protein
MREPANIRLIIVAVAELGSLFFSLADLNGTREETK